MTIIETPCNNVMHEKTRLTLGLEQALTRHRARDMGDGWTRLECISCGQVKFVRTEAINLGDDGDGR